MKWLFEVKMKINWNPLKAIRLGDKSECNAQWDIDECVVVYDTHWTNVWMLPNIWSIELLYELFAVIHS